MADRKIKLAVRGATNGATFRGNPELFSPLQARRNFRAHNVQTGRPGGSRRACLERVIDRQLRDAPVNGLLVVRRARAVAGYIPSGWADIGAGISNLAGPLLGQIAALSDVPSTDWFIRLDVTGTGGPANNAVQHCALYPANDYLAVTTNYAVGGFWRFTVAKVHPTTGQILWRTESVDVGYNRRVNAVCVTKLYTWVALSSDHPAAGRVLIMGFRNDTGVMSIFGNLGGWAQEAVGLARYTAPGGQESLFVAYAGASAAGTYTGGAGGGVIKAGVWARHFRAGIMKFSVEGQSYGGGGTVMATYGPQLAASDPYFEATHHSWRLSEQTSFRPHGGEFTGIACGADGSVYFTKRNQGWGPNDTLPDFAPNGTHESYWTVGKINPDGTLAWLQDTDSIKEAYQPATYTNYFNDLDYPGKANPDPSVGVLCVDAQGQLYAAGRRTGTTNSVFALSTEDGTGLWAATLMSGALSVRAAALDAGGNPWFAGDRNNGWTTAAGRQAHLWKLRRDGSGVSTIFDVEQAVDALGVACHPDGRVFYTLEETPP